MQKDFINKVSLSTVFDLWNSGCNVVPLLATHGNCTHAHWSWSLTVPLKMSGSSDVVPSLIAAQKISQVIKNIYLHSVWENMKIRKAYWQLHNLIYEGKNVNRTCKNISLFMDGSLWNVQHNTTASITHRRFALNLCTYGTFQCKTCVRTALSTARPVHYGTSHC